MALQGAQMRTVDCTISDHHDNSRWAMHSGAQTARADLLSAGYASTGAGSQLGRHSSALQV